MPRPAAHQLRRGASQGRTPGGDYYHGEKHQLVVLVAYHDRAFKGDEAETLEQWDKIFNTKNLMEDPSAAMRRNMPALLLMTRIRNIWCRTS